MTHHQADKTAPVVGEVEGRELCEPPSARGREGAKAVALGFEGS